MDRVYIFLIVLGLLLAAVKGYSQQNPEEAGPEIYTVSGEILYDGSAEVTVMLVDEDTFGVRQEGLQVRIPEPEGGRLIFVFTGIPPGRYGIRCFADENGNGELDGGAFGPKEPWGMSWQGEPKRGIPRFRDISFDVRSDISVTVVLGG